ncbi:hypothetical protein [Sphingomonas sp. Sph1(2015)]|jgi:iron complex outermembrane receptor protein|nr:hypothetical protein [Sphingomonas sp. Sph1(2015)]
MAYGPSRLRKWALASAAVGALILAVDAQAQTQATGGGARAWRKMPPATI